MADQARQLSPVGTFQPFQATNTISAYAVVQTPLGKAGIWNSGSALNAGSAGALQTSGNWNILKTTGIVLLAGGRAYWDYSAGTCTFQKVNDRDFYIGRVVQDASSANPTAIIDLNADPPYDIDLNRDPYTTVEVGTQALGGFLPPQRNGGATTLLMSATSEAQKSDMLGKDGFAAGGAAAIIEFAFNIISVGSGSGPKFNIGIASGTHATDVTSIGQYLTMRADGNATKIQFQSTDGTHTVSETDSTVTFTAGAGNANRVEVWMDLRTIASVKLYVNGVAVLTGTTFNLSSAAATWLPLVHLVKASSTNTFQSDLEWWRARFSIQ